MLYEVITPEPLAVGDETRLLRFGIGLTDLAKGVSGGDAEIPARAYDPARLRAFLAQHRPHSFAFNGKNAARRFLGATRVDFGPIDLGGLRVWILPSTSGAANGAWDEAVWRAFGTFLSEIPFSLPRITSYNVCYTKLLRSRAGSRRAGHRGRSARSRRGSPRGSVAPRSCR